MATTTAGAGGSQPCGACRFLRRKCTSDCIFAPHFSSEQGPASFAAIHRVFGASNVSKLLSHVPVPARRDAIITIAFEAQSRIKDPVYGCVSQVLALQQQVEYLQDQVIQMRAQLEQNYPIDDDPLSRIAENQWPNSNVTAGTSPTLPNYINYSNSAQGSLFDEDVSFQGYSKQRPSHTGLSELQELALRMMKNKN